MNILKIIKVNIMSAVAILVFALALLGEVISSVIKKSIYIIGTLMMMGLFALAFYIIQNFEQVFQNFLLIMLCMGILGFGLYVVFAIGSVVITAVTIAISFVVGVADAISKSGREFFVDIYDACENEYDYLVDSDENKMKNFAKYPIYTIMKCLTKIMLAILVKSNIIMSVSSLIILVGMVYIWKQRINAVFGIGLIAYIGKFPTISIVRGIVMLIIMFAGIFATLSSFGLQWSIFADTIDRSIKGEELWLEEI